MLLAMALVGCLLGCGGRVEADTYIITLDAAARSEPATGRVILFFITRNDRRWVAHSPMEAPFFDAPQPIASVAVKDFKPGDSVIIDGTTPAFPESLDKLDGWVRVQAVLDADQTERSHDAGPGNVYSEVLRQELSPTKDETVRLTLTKPVLVAKPEDHPNLKWVRFRSELLSKFYGRDVYHRAGVALPKQYNDPKWPRQQWPAIYVVPGYGGRDDAAENYRDMLLTMNVEEIAPIGVYIVLDPESPLGHHFFVDSANNGMRETALMTEFIPYLEKEFRLVAKPEARLITGHSSGGWSSLWLQLKHPEVFGGCWSSSPDPIDFHAFQMTDLYADESIFVDAAGKEVPSYRNFIDASGQPAPLMKVRQEVGMEQAIDPDGRSGQQWSSWNACFSKRDEKTGLPVSMFDPKTGQIDKAVVETWQPYDIRRMVEKDWKRYGPIVKSKVHLACGDLDSYFLNRAVERFKEAVEKLKKEEASESGAADVGGGYVLMVAGATHDTVTPNIFMRWNSEMRTHLQKNGLQDADRPAK